MSKGSILKKARKYSRNGKTKKVMSLFLKSGFQSIKEFAKAIGTTQEKLARTYSLLGR